MSWHLALVESSGTLLGELQTFVALTLPALRVVQPSHYFYLSFQVSFNKLLKGLGQEPQYTYIIAGGDR